MQLDATAPIAIKIADLSSIDDLVAENPRQLTKPALLWQLRHRDKNGLAPACVRMGKKLLISKSRYEAWLGTRAGAAS